MNLMYSRDRKVSVARIKWTRSRIKKITLERIRTVKGVTYGLGLQNIKWKMVWEKQEKVKKKDKNSRNNCEEERVLSKWGGYASKELGILKEKQIQSSTTNNRKVEVTYATNRTRQVRTASPGNVTDFSSVGKGNQPGSRTPGSKSWLYQLLCHLDKSSNLS